MMAAPTVLPHSFVLAELFDVAAMSYPVPDYVLEDEPELVWVTCPGCEGERWVETNGFAWQTPRLLALRTDLCKGVVQCPRCKGWGEVLEVPSAPLTTSQPLQTYAPRLKRAA